MSATCCVKLQVDHTILQAAVSRLGSDDMPPRRNWGSVASITDVRLRDDLGCVYAECIACAGVRGGSGSGVHMSIDVHRPLVLLPDAECTSVWCPWLQDAREASGNVLLLRSVLNSARRRHPECRRDVADLVRGQPWQRVSVLEDIYHASCSESFAVVQKAAVHIMESEVLQPNATAAVASVATAPSTLSVTMTTDDLLADLLGEVELYDPVQATDGALQKAAEASRAPQVTPAARRDVTTEELSIAAAVSWLTAHAATSDAQTRFPIVILCSSARASVLSRILAAAGVSPPQFAARNPLTDDLVAAALAAGTYAGTATVVVLPLDVFIESVLPGLVSRAASQERGAAIAPVERIRHLRLLAQSCEQAAAARRGAILRVSGPWPPSTPDGTRTALSNGAPQALITVSGARSDAQRRADNASRRTLLFPPHESSADVEAWVSGGVRPPCAGNGGRPSIVVAGIFRAGTNHRGRVEGYVAVGTRGAGSVAAAAAYAADREIHETMPRDQCKIVLNGHVACNRAIDGDLVAVEVLSPSKHALSLILQAGSRDLSATTTSRPDSLMSATDDAMWGNDGDMLTLRNADATSELDDDDDDESDVAAAAPSLAADGRSVIAASASPIARVIGILSRRTKAIVATVLDVPDVSGDAAAEGEQGRSVQFVFAVPMDRRLPRFRLATRQSSVLRGQRLLLRLASWPADSTYPVAAYAAALGPAGDLDTEIRCILVETELDAYMRAFPPAALACLPQLPPSRRWSVPWHRLLLALSATAGSVPAAMSRAVVDAIVASESSSRRDMRWDTEICSVDPPGCTGE